MAHLELTESIVLPGRRDPLRATWRGLRRIWRLYRQSWPLALAEAREGRQALRRERALRHLDLALLRDIGLDRSAS